MRWLTAAGLIVLCLSARAEERIGLALSGGGARGLAHIGALKALEELRVPVHAIAGTSMGAMIGALYAAGLSPDEIAEQVGAIDWQQMLSDERGWEEYGVRDRRESRRYFLGVELGLAEGRRLAPTGAVAGQQLELLLRRLAGRQGAQKFSDLRIPLRVVATDVNAAEAVGLDDGDLARAVRASMAIPLLFEPVTLEGRLLVDGGILDNLPVAQTREMGANLVIAVDISSPLGDIGSDSSLFEVAYRSIDTALVQNTIRSLGEADLVVSPDLGALSAADFESIEAFVQAGYDAVMARRRFIEVLSVSPSDYAAWLAQTRSTLTPPDQAVAFIEFEGNRRTDERRLMARAESLLGTTPGSAQIEEVIERLYALESFVSITYEPIQDARGFGLRFQLREKPWGPDYLKFGLRIESDLGLSTDFSLLGRHRRLNLNPLGGEWINDVEIGTRLGLSTRLHQPLDYRSRWYASPHASARQYVQPIYADRDDLLAEYEIREVGGGLDLGYQRFHSRASLGLWRGVAASRREVGERGRFPQFDDQQTAVRLGYVRDTLDHRLFPRNGSYVDATFSQFTESLGGDHRYQRLDLTAYRRLPLGRFSAAHLEAKAHWLRAPEALPESAFVSLGGLDDLAGYPRHALIGTQAVVLRAGLMTGVQRWQLPVVGAPRLIGLIHAGQVWGEDEDPATGDIRWGASGGAALDFLGAILFAGGGWTQDGDLRYYLRVGTGF